MPILERPISNPNAYPSCCYRHELSAAYEDLKAKYEKLEGELAMRKRAQHGKGSEKPRLKSSMDIFRE